MRLPGLKIGKIGAREKAWIVAWVAVVLGLGIARFVYKPRVDALRELKMQMAVQDKERMLLVSKQPDLDKRRKEIALLKEEISGRFDELTEGEKDLLDDRDVDKLLESLVKDRRRFEMMLNAIRPVARPKESSSEETPPSPSGKTQSEPYRKLTVQIDLFATFQGLLSYVDFLEKMRPYQWVDGIKVKVEGKDVSRPHAVLLLGVLMGETQAAKENSRKEVFALLDDVAKRDAKDPFLTSDKPKEVVQAVGLQLTGIFSSEGQPPAAMINDEIYHVGEVIQDKRIVQIQENQVLLEQGNRRFVLLPSQQRKEGTS